jgi:ribose/xylose/arabinose/galactoside ABC-type transport system permease subunit
VDILCVCCHSWFFLTQTRFGRNIYAIGGNEQAARVAGINVEKNLVLVYTWCSFCAAVGGVLLAARSGSGNSTLGLNYELDAIAAATVGGTSHSGGVCRLSGVIAGILILGILKNGLLLLNVSPYIQQAVKGIIIVGAVVFDMRKNAKRV